MKGQSGLTKVGEIDNSNFEELDASQSEIEIKLNWSKNEFTKYRRKTLEITVKLQKSRVISSTI